jgi:hypothetical protein
VPGLISERAQIIETYINQNPKCVANDNWPMEFGGKIEYRPVYEIPIRFLCYNINNGRYAVELAGLQVAEGYELDPTTATDRVKLRNLLLSLDPEKTALLKSDIAERGQVYPGVITEDGFVINANRRMAILEALHEEHPNQYETLLVQRLPAGTSPVDLWRLEAGLQLSRDTRADYSPINELLKLREGREAGLNVSELAAAMFGRKAVWVEESLARLQIMEQYLNYRSEPLQYHLLEGSNEQFIELQKNLKALERDGIPAEEEYEWLILHFKAIDAGLTNWQIREFKKMAVDEDASQLLLDVARSEAASPVDVKSAFKAAQTTIESKEEKNEPKLLLQRAHAILSQINQANPHLSTGENRYLFKKIRTIVKQLETALGS